MLFCDSYAAFIVFISSAFFILSATRGNEHHECLRPCADDPSTRKLCQYEFYVSAIYRKNSSCNDTRHNNDIPKCKGQGGETFLGINGITPGPSIEVCIGDTIEVRVHNKLGTEELSVHWHGLRQQGSVHMDGVPMVTQCPILPYSSFRYKIKPEETGTYFYHAHSVSQQADGVYGSLTVRGPQDDPTLERIYLLSSRPPTSLTRYLHLHPPTPSQLLLNGQNDGTILLVRSGTEYLLRLVNANAYDCPVLLSTYGHRFQAVATDGNLVQSMRAAQAVLFSGNYRPGPNKGVSFKEKVRKEWSRLNVRARYKGYRLKRSRVKLKR